MKTERKEGQDDKPPTPPRLALCSARKGYITGTVLTKWPNWHIWRGCRRRKHCACWQLWETDHKSLWISKETIFCPFLRIGVVTACKRRGLLKQLDLSDEDGPIAPLSTIILISLNDLVRQWDRPEETADGKGKRFVETVRERYIYVPITSCNGTFRLQKVKKQRERWKTKARKGKDEKEDKTLKREKSPHLGGFLGHFYYKTGEIENLTIFWPTDWGCGHTYIYIYIYAVVLLSGPSLAFWGVIIWAKFAFYKTLFVKNTIKIGVSALFFWKKNWRAQIWGVIIWAKLVIFKMQSTWPK